MDYEKKYKEALARAKALHGTVAAGRDFLVEIFPELRESEDERIRKWIASYIQRGVFNEEEYPKALRAIEWREKQKEQKSLSEKFRPDFPAVADFIESVDNMEKNKAIEILKQYLVWAENSEEDCPYTWKELAEAIKDGIAALEQKQEWSEEDELNIGWLIAYLKGESAGEDYDEMMRESLVDWLKSLKNRGNSPKSNTNSPSWKPSEEQMGVFDGLYHNYILDQRDYKVLESLYNDLKKLM